MLQSFTLKAGLCVIAFIQFSPLPKEDSIVTAAAWLAISNPTENFITLVIVIYFVIASDNFFV